MLSTQSSTTQANTLQYSNEETYTPQKGEVLLQVRAVSLNYRDLVLIDGSILKPKLSNVIPISDASAEVIEVGEGVKDFIIGDRVVAAFHPRWFSGPKLSGRAFGSYGYDQDGWLTQYKIVPQDALVHLPASLSFAEGATFTVCCGYCLECIAR